MFSERDPIKHKHLKNSVAQLFSMTNMRGYEVYADECTEISMEAMKDLQGEPIELSEWLQWYAFDVITSITFQRRFGFMEQRKDVNNLIWEIDCVLQYVRFIGQTPELHPWLAKDPWKVEINSLVVSFVYSINFSTGRIIGTGRFTFSV
jgi:cytochrome P450